MEFKSAIIDECGYVVYWCEERLTDRQIEIILSAHPEWKVRCMPAGGQTYEVV